MFRIRTCPGRAAKARLPDASFLLTRMLRRTFHPRRAAFGFAARVYNALDAHVVAANQAASAVFIGFALIFAAHHAALFVRRFNDIARLLQSRAVVAAIPRRRICRIVQKGEIVERVADAVAGVIDSAAFAGR